MTSHPKLTLSHTDKFAGIYIRNYGPFLLRKGKVLEILQFSELVIEDEFKVKSQRRSEAAHRSGNITRQ